MNKVTMVSLNVVRRTPEGVVAWSSTVRGITLFSAMANIPDEMARREGIANAVELSDSVKSCVPNLLASNLNDRGGRMTIACFDGGCLALGRAGDWDDYESKLDPMAAGECLLLRAAKRQVPTFDRFRRVVSHTYAIDVQYVSDGEVIEIMWRCIRRLDLERITNLDIVSTMLKANPSSYGGNACAPELQRIYSAMCQIMRFSEVRHLSGWRSPRKHRNEKPTEDQLEPV